jgi:hypothetical protein
LIDNLTEDDVDDDDDDNGKYVDDVAEELGDLRVQLKMLEEKNTQYMQQQIEMEEVRPHYIHQGCG